MPDQSTELSDKLIPILKEYDLPDALMALSWHLAGATDLASKATKINRELAIALAYAEQKTFWTHKALRELISKT